MLLLLLLPAGAIKGERSENVSILLSGFEVAAEDEEEAAETAARRRRPAMHVSMGGVQWSSRVLRLLGLA